MAGYHQSCLVIILLVVLIQISNNGGVIVDVLQRVLYDVEAMLRSMGISLLGIALKPQTFEQLEGEYDFVIIGGGSAGSVIANRLSESPHWRILLLEAGDRENLVAQIPLLAPILQWSDFNWGFKMQPQPHACKAMIDYKCSLARGKGLGGSSIINGMIYTRGTRLDYDAWNIPGWRYNDVLPYFIKSERVQLPPNTYYEPKYHGTDGYLDVSGSFTSPLSDAFLHAGLEFGYDIIDYNAKGLDGFGNIQSTTRNGRRLSSARAFLEPVADHRPNLHIKTRALVTRIAIDAHTNRALGVHFLHADKEYYIAASKEVILSAGAISSPQILMLSGVGPHEHLQELGIPIRMNLPVGDNLQDHPGYVGLSFLLNQTVENPGAILNPLLIAKYLNTGVGPLSSLGGFEALAFMNTQREDANPDVELIFAGAGSLSTDYGILNRRIFRIIDKYYDASFKNDEGRPSFSIYPMLLHPKSRGYIRLASTNPKTQPLIHMNYYTDANAYDKKTLVAGIQAAIDLVTKSSSFKPFGVHLSTNQIPDCIPFEFPSDAYWSCALEFYTTTFHHSMGTCRMGDDGVVNNQLKVHGIAGLRVADASIMPEQISGHLNTPAMMIGEKASDLIKHEWE